MRLIRLLVVLGLIVTTLVGTAAAAVPKDPVGEVRARLETVPGLRVESGKLLNGKPFFVLWFRQPSEPSRRD
ncbi:hypothetical protein EV646_10627 [Kribbella antiqua]|uniref:Uncharacterized protein n=1 Tax=Kribbella antiqua TaxID=2512217 RepID=A0A4R2IRS7_9ACTN|nr:hypothetical protein [Kribbella antiqua]TCO46788.1 hypothetical protein EV646_10627 [Kribbella antiqua]